MGRIPVVVEGLFWFFYHDSREMKDHPEFGSHFHWNVNIADVLSQEERTTYISFKGPTNSVVHEDYDKTCENI